MLVVVVIFSSPLDPNCREYPAASGRIPRYRLHSRRDTKYAPVAGQTEIAKTLDREDKESRQNAVKSETSFWQSHLISSQHGTVPSGTPDARIQLGLWTFVPWKSLGFRKPVEEIRRTRRPIHCCGMRDSSHSTPRLMTVIRLLELLDCHQLAVSVGRITALVTRAMVSVQFLPQLERHSYLLLLVCPVDGPAQQSVPTLRDVRNGAWLAVLRTNNVAQRQLWKFERYLLVLGLGSLDIPPTRKELGGPTDRTPITILVLSAVIDRTRTQTVRQPSNRCSRIVIFECTQLVLSVIWIGGLRYASELGNCVETTYHGFFCYAGFITGKAIWKTSPGPSKPLSPVGTTYLPNFQAQLCNTLQ
ncbi:hypothetical protein ARMGADRAFT_1063063 [Armillaria gallica]|uniref:Uncharacterized protein n=1 Tax=Armillaria gallica TaxID=47427 RepID=A0A2H3DFA0_ARMGA|nr:hypothetical protein ARMGADRAFT_1063063 [Armillaria gallica]